MINSEFFTKRINEILDQYELSASAFAEKIEVGRSAVSHILSGRNKPSLDFILKILEAFPEVDFYWLTDEKSKTPLPSKPVKNTSHPSPVSTEADLSQNKISEENSSQTKSMVSQNKREVDKVVILYKDGGFEIYKG